MIEDYMPTDPLMALAWRDCLRWAITYQPILDAFLAESGVRIAPLRTTLDRMICESSGEGEAIARKFVVWFNTTIWGEAHGRENNDLQG